MEINMKILKPDLILENVFAIDLRALRARNISGLLLDIDNTLVRWKQPRMEKEFIRWIKLIQENDFKLCLVSNAMEKRVSYFAELLDIPAVGQAWKPFNSAFLRGLDLLHLEASQAAVVGDQLFTDIFGGNRLGLYTILINPLSEREFFGTKIMRKLERFVLAKMVKKGRISPEFLRIRQRRR